MITSWEMADLLALLYVMFYCVFVTFPCGVLGQVWCLIVSIPGLCLSFLLYFLAFLCVVFSRIFVSIYIGALGQVWYLIVSIPNLCLLLYFNTVLSCPCSLVITCWERADLLAVLCIVFPFFVYTFPYCVLGPLWYLIVSFPDLCLSLYFVIR